MASTILFPWPEPWPHLAEIWVFEAVKAYDNVTSATRTTQR